MDIQSNIGSITVTMNAEEAETIANSLLARAETFKGGQFPNVQMMHEATAYLIKSASQLANRKQG